MTYLKKLTKNSSNDQDLKMKPLKNENDLVIDTSDEITIDKIDPADTSTRIDLKMLRYK